MFRAPPNSGCIAANYEQEGSCLHQTGNIDSPTVIFWADCVSYVSSTTLVMLTATGRIRNEVTFDPELEWRVDGLVGDCARCAQPKPTRTLTNMKVMPHTVQSVSMAVYCILLRNW